MASYFKIIGIGGVIIMALVALVVGRGLLSPKVATITEPAASFSVTSAVPRGSDVTVSLQMGRRSDNDRFIAAFVRPKHRINVYSGNGANSVMGVFRPDDVQDYINTYYGTRKNPTKFLRRKIHLIYLFAATPSVAEKLKTWKHDDFEKVDQWENVQISGRCLREDVTFTQDGEDITHKIKTIGKRPGSGDCLSIWVESFEAKPANLVP